MGRLKVNSIGKNVYHHLYSSYSLVFIVYLVLLLTVIKPAVSVIVVAPNSEAQSNHHYEYGPSDTKDQKKNNIVDFHVGHTNEAGTDSSLESINLDLMKLQKFNNQNFPHSTKIAFDSTQSKTKDRSWILMEDAATVGLNTINVTELETERTSNGISVAKEVFRTFFSNPVYPGTIWCGRGNFATNDFTLGFFVATDLCCRQHDKCFESIPAGGSKYGLKNWGLFTKSHCDCDREFHKCLKQTNNFVSNKIGKAYFNILRPQCFRFEFPIVQCIQRYDKRCLIYLVDETQNRQWQWFDNKSY